MWCCVTNTLLLFSICYLLLPLNQITVPLYLVFVCLFATLGTNKLAPVSRIYLTHRLAQTGTYSRDQGTTVAPLAAALAIVQKINDSNVSLKGWEERLESAVHLYPMPTKLIAELLNNFLEDDASQAIIVLSEEECANLEQIVAWLTGLFRGENVTLAEVR